MASIGLLEELKLNEYYPQKLSFSEAIKLRGESQNGCQEQFGLEIVRKLLTFDSTAVISVTTEINKRLNNTGSKEAETKGQCVSDGARRQRTRDKRGQSKRKLHPTDLLVAVMNCCDDFLRQILVEKMFANKLSIPILLPEVRNDSNRPTLLLLALRSLVPGVQDPKREYSDSLTDTLVDVRNPIVSFLRVGNLHRSKSKLVNELLNLNSFNAFFHRECQNGSAKRSVSNGSIEAAWFQSETATEEFNCRLFTALNLRGNAGDYPKQTQFLCQSSTLTVLMVDSFVSFKSLYENVLKTIDMSQTKIIVCCISSESPDVGNETNFDLWEDRSGHIVISEMSYDWNEGEKMSDVDFTNDLRQIIFEFLKPEHTHSDKMQTYTNIIQRGKHLGFSLDEDKSEYISGKAGADDFIDLVLKLPPDCKPIILPLQGEPWKEIGRLEREQRGKSQEKRQGEHFIAEKETEKKCQRIMQCRSLIKKTEITHNFSFKFHFLQEQNRWYYLNSCKIKLDARTRVFTSKLLEEYKKEKQENRPQLLNEGESEGRLKEIELKIENSNIGLHHILRECGQMYEAVISEEIRMREELNNASLTLDNIHNFPTIVARLLLTGQPLELMDGDASNVPITWLKAVLSQIRILTNTAKLFVLSIVGVQSSGKSTLLNALFGLQFPVSSGRCTKGIYCHLVPFDKESLHVEYDYVLVVDTEGLGSSQVTENSTFRDNELATFAIGLADATIINMKGENWAEMKDILQIAAHGLIRVRKTKAELELMPRCMFVHQNVPAADAEEKNRLGQENQLLLLDKAIRDAGIKEGFTEITKFDQVIMYDPGSHSWYFPDLWNGRPPKARISQDYIEKTNELRQYLMQLMKNCPSKLTVSSFILRMSDLWNAMLHNDFVLCFRNTQEIIAGTFLNDRISHAVDDFKSLNKLEQTKIRESIYLSTGNEELRAQKERILIEVNSAVEKNFINMKATLQSVINSADICAALKEKYEATLSEIREGEHLRINNEMAKDLSVHMRKLKYENDERVKNLKARLADLEKRIEDVEKDTLNETEMKEFEKQWRQLIADNKKLLDEGINIVECKIKETICESIAKLSPKEKIELNTVDSAELFKSPLVIEMPKMTESDIVQNKETTAGWVMDYVYSKSYVCKANSRFHVARKLWELQFQSQKDLEFDSSILKQIIISEVGRLLGISNKEEYEVRPGSDEISSNSESSASHVGQIMSGVGQMFGFTRKEHEARPEADEMCLVLPPGYSFTPDYTIRFIEFVCHYTYNRSLENSKRFISLTDPLADIDERYIRSISNYRQMSAEANIDIVSKQIFEYARRSFIRDLGELLKTEVCKEDNKNQTFKSKRSFLRTILTDLGQKTHDLTRTDGEKEKIFKEFMLYVELGESEDSENFFFDAILKLLKEMLINENAAQTEFQKMVENNVGKVVEKAENALKQAETNCKECPKEYIRIFKEYMSVTCEIDLRSNTMDGFRPTKAVIEKIDSLYTDFLSQANSSFETLAREENRAAIRTLFEKIMGCREICPFCSAPCSQSLQQHAGDHRANHYPTGVRGAVECWHWFRDVQETRDLTKEEKRKARQLALDTCQTMVGSTKNIRTKVTVQTYSKWYHDWFGWNYQSLKNYKEVKEYGNWDIPYSADPKTSLYWKWFMVQFVEELAVHYDALCPKIPEAWIDVTWEDAKQSLDEPDLISQSSVEE